MRSSAWSPPSGSSTPLACSHSPAGARVAHRVLDRLAGERAAADRERSAGVALEREQALLRPDEQFGHRLPPEVAGSTFTRSSSATAVSPSAASAPTKTLM